MAISALDAVGTVGAFLTTVAFLPQVIKTVRTRRTRDISTAMWSLFSAGVAVWLVYGVMLGATPIIVANAITLVLSLTVLGVKLSNRGREHLEDGT